MRIRIPFRVDCVPRGDKVASVGESASVPAIIGLLVDMLTYSLEIDLGTVSISSCQLCL